jgi:hypothetical protein
MNINLNSNIPTLITNDYNNGIKEDNYKKMYNKKQKAELDMVRGCFIYDKKFFNFDIKNGSNTINYIKFIKPSEPIIQINYRNVDKFYPLIRNKFIKEINNDINNNNLYYNNSNNYNINNNINNNKNNFKRYKTFIGNKLSKLNNNYNSQYEIKTNNNDVDNININKKTKKKKKIPIPPNTNNNIFQLSNNSNYNKAPNDNNKYNYNNSINSNKIDKDGISIQLKQKIYDWLVDIDIIKDKIITIDSLPTLCINGVLLCDLINRCEGKNEILKGIIRRTSTRSQIQVNINKVLEYLRSLEKFPSRHLWNNLEISKGNSLIIWQLLDDIYNFYGNKIKFKRKNKKNNSNNLNRTFTQPKTNINNNNDNLEFENLYSHTPLKKRRMKNNIINDNKYSNFTANKNDYWKYNSYTPNVSLCIFPFFIYLY